MTIGSKMDLLDQLDQHLVPVERYLMETPKFPKLSLLLRKTEGPRLSCRSQQPALGNIGANLGRPTEEPMKCQEGHEEPRDHGMRKNPCLLARICNASDTSNILDHVLRFL